MKTSTFIVLIIALLAIFVCINVMRADPTVDSDIGYYSKGCINGVLYYKSGYRLAPAVDAETLSFIRCEVK